MSAEAAAFLRARRRPLELVIFDCDGVLIDSEAISNRVVAEVLTEEGWPMTAEESEHRFIGLSYSAMRPMIAAELGRPLGPEWVTALVARVIAAMEREATPMPGAHAALTAASALGLPWRIASNSSHDEMKAKFGRVGWLDLVQGRVHSAVDAIARGGAGKPAPDVFLHAAAAEPVPPAHCLVIEDSVAGATAAQRAGMDCLALVRHGDASGHRAVGAVPFAAVHDLADLLRMVRG